MKSRLLRYEEFDKMSSTEEKKLELQILKEEYTRIEQGINLAGYNGKKLNDMYKEHRRKNEF